MFLSGVLLKQSHFARRAAFSSQTGDQWAKHRQEFDRLKQQISLLNQQKQKQEDFKIGKQEENEDDAVLPQKISDINKIDFILKADRTVLDFRNEALSLYQHQDSFQRPRLAHLMNNIYIPKLKAKAFAAFVYAGETNENHSDYQKSINGPNLLFDNPERSRDDLILGIESSFDESAASLVNSFGEVKSSHQVTQWDLWSEFDGIVPEVAQERHSINLPKLATQALQDLNISKGDPRLKAIAVTIGPGQEKSLNAGIKYA